MCLSISVGILSILVTLLIGFQIYQVVGFEQKIKKALQQITAFEKKVEKRILVFEQAE